MTKISWIMGLMLVIFSSTALAQTYDQYFFNKAKADSLVASGNYIAAIPHLKVCVSEPEMVTVRDEFNLGYALFKQDKIDSATFFMHKALAHGFHFQDMAQVKYWADAGVFEKFRSYVSLRGIAKLLEVNTRMYVDENIDSVLLNELLEAREKDQRFRGSDFSKQLPLDKENQVFLEKIIEEHGWPTHDMVGWHGSNAAFLVAQHSDNDIKFQTQCLGYIRDAYYTQKIDPSSYAYIIDRVRVNTGRPQVFGSQYDQPIEDPKHVDLRRKILGMESLESYLKKRK